MIRTENLCKRYGRQLVVNQLNLTVRPGTVFGIVGENGAGKTTTLSMLVTLTAPTSGRAFVNGFEVAQDPVAVRRSVGYMPDSFGVFDDIRCMEYLQFYADCYRVPRPVARQRARELLAWVGLEDKQDAYVNALSRGMQQRLELARCLMHDPAVLVLDEPSSGLDPRSRLEMRAILLKLKDAGKTVLLSSHILHELVEVADELGFMRSGELQAVASVDVLRNHTSAYRTLQVVGEAPEHVWRHALAADGRVVEFRLRPGGAQVQYGGTTGQQAELLQRLVTAGVAVQQFYEEAVDVEALFLRLTASHDTSVEAAP
ncbi:MAG: ABC transporter ATP-binding protein [Alicyclobacillus sp.]|nr:ABC transporter ATP-binding protein [Alicyclobacillus sp.]